MKEAPLFQSFNTLQILVLLFNLINLFILIITSITASNLFWWLNMSEDWNAYVPLNKRIFFFEDNCYNLNFF